MLVRKVKADEVLNLDYHKLAKQVFYPEDPALQERKVVIPGEPLSFKIDTEEDQDLVVYFFFTDWLKEDRWWKKIRRQILPTTIVFVLGDREIIKVQER